MVDGFPPLPERLPPWRFGPARVLGLGGPWEGSGLDGGRVTVSAELAHWPRKRGDKRKGLGWGCRMPWGSARSSAFREGVSGLSAPVEHVQLLFSFCLSQL